MKEIKQHQILSPKACKEITDVNKHQIVSPKASMELKQIKHEILSPKTSASSDSLQKRPVPAPRKLRNVQPGLQKLVVFDNSTVENLEVPKLERAECSFDEVNSPKSPSCQQFTFYEADELDKSTTSNEQSELKSILKVRNQESHFIPIETSNHFNENELDEAGFSGAEDDFSSFKRNSSLYRSVPLKTINFKTKSKNKLQRTKSQDNVTRSSYDLRGSNDYDVVGSSNDVTRRLSHQVKASKKVTFHSSTKLNYDVRNTSESSSESDSDYEKWDATSVRNKIRRKKRFEMEKRKLKQSKDKNCIVM